MTNDLQKISRWESKKYREWVAKLPCGNCKAEDDTIVAHHLAHILAPHCGGTSLKASDYLTMPPPLVCGTCLRRVTVFKNDLV